MKLLLLLLPIFSYSQTVVIAKKNSKSIIVSSDSRMTVYLGGLTNSNKTREYGSICKIYTMGKFNFAVMGGAIRDNINIASNACRNGSKFEDVIQSFAKNFIDTITPNLEQLRTYVPSYYTDYIENLRPNFCQTIFFGYQDDTAFLKAVFFRVTNKLSEKVNIEAYLQERNLLYGGHVKEIKDTMEIESTWEAGVIKTMNRLIRVAEQFHKEEVGGAIQVVQVKRRKVKWISKKPPCN